MTTPKRPRIIYMPDRFLVGAIRSLGLYDKKDRIRVLKALFAYYHKDLVEVKAELRVESQ